MENSTALRNTRELYGGSICRGGSIGFDRTRYGRRVLVPVLVAFPVRLLRGRRGLLRGDEVDDGRDHGAVARGAVAPVDGAGPLDFLLQQQIQLLLQVLKGSRRHLKPFTD